MNFVKNYIEHFFILGNIKVGKDFCMVDVLVIGAGPAGISSAIYAKRAGLSVMILYGGLSNLEKTEKIENYYGFENGVSGKDLYIAGINQAKNLEIQVKKEEIFNIEKERKFLFC